jgi:endoglucanase
MEILKRFNMKIIGVFVLIVCNATLFAQTRFIIADDFKGSQFRGFNISVVENYSILKGKNLSKIRSAGANHVRIWVKVAHDANNRYYFQSPTAIKTIDSAVRQATKVGLYLILTAEFYPKQGADDWWGNYTRKSNIIKFWRDSLANRYKDKKIIAAYDLMNEPRKNIKLTFYDAIKQRTVPYVCTTKEYTQFQYDMISAIRRVDPNHAIVVEVLENQMLGDLSIRSDSVIFKRTLMTLKNLVYSPHGYSPLAITHQGVSTSTRRIYPESSGTYIANYFKNVTYWNEPAKFQRKYNLPIWVGEFACVNWAPKNSYGQWTSTRWTQDVIAYMESLGWSWSGHAWREYVGWEVEMPSSWYATYSTFNNAKPSKYPPSSARTDSAPTFALFRQFFAKNRKYYSPYYL